MKILIILIIIFIALTLRFFYCVGQLNKKYDVDLDKAWEKEFEEE